MSAAEPPPPSPRSSYPLKYQPLLCLSAAFLSGIVAGDILLQPNSGWVILLLTLLAASLILLFRFLPQWELLRLQWQQRFPLTPGWFILLFAAGILRFAVAQPVFTETDVAFYNEQGKATFTAVVINPPREQEHSTYLTVAAATIHPFYEDFQSGIHLVQGRMRVSTLRTQPFRYGDELRIICTPQTPQSSTGFDYQRYLAARKIYTSCEFAFVERIGEGQGNELMRFIYGIRDHAQSTINRMLPPDEAALLSGILLGNEDHIAPEVEAAFQRTGTSHIIAISGANFTVLITFLTALILRRLPRKWVLPVSLLLITFYTVLVGGNAAVVRAAIMGGLSVFGSYFGRRNQGLNALTFSAAVFVLANPLILWDLGFQLSVGATLGLVLFGEREKEMLGTWLVRWMPEAWANRITNWVGEYALMTFSAQIFTLPLIAYSFQHISLSSFVVNLLILPVQPLIMGLGGLATLVGMLLPFAGDVLGRLAWVPLTYTIRIVSWGSQWRWSEIILPRYSSVGLMLYFVVLTVWPLLTGWLPKRRKLVNQSGFTLLLTGLVIVTWTTALQQPDADFHLYLFPLDTSTAVLVQLPDGKAMLMGRSTSMDDLNHALEEVRSGYQLSVYFQPDAGWRALNRIEELTTFQPITELFVNPEIGPDTATQVSAQLSAGTRLHQLIPNQTIQLMENARLTTIAVREESAAFLLQYGNLKILMPNTLPYSVLRQLEPAALQGTTVLVLNSAELEEEALQEWLAHPTQYILVNGAILHCGDCFSTAEYGLLHLRSDGVGISLEGFE